MLKIQHVTIKKGNFPPGSKGNERSFDISENRSEILPVVMGIC